MDFRKNIPEIEKKIRYTFKDKALLRQAFIRSSFCNEKNRGGRNEYISNEILEFFGDSVLSTVIVGMLLDDKTRRYEHGVYTELDEGDFSNIRSKLSDKRNLSKSMAELGLQRFLEMGEGDAKLGVENEPSVMEDLFESIVGAIYIDCGMDIAVVSESVRAMLDVSVYFSDDAPAIQSFKNALQEWCADKKHRFPAPVYKTLSESGPDHKRTYERAVYIGDRLVGVGKGKNQKIADSLAAEAALLLLKKEEISSTVSDSDSLVRLRELAAKNKQPSPEFRDLGETPDSTANEREYIIECRTMGKIASGVGKSKQEARAAAAKKILDELEKKSEPRVVKRSHSAPTPKAEKPRVKGAVHARHNAKKADKSPTPKRAPHQHKKHL